MHSFALKGKVSLPEVDGLRACFARGGSEQDSQRQACSRLLGLTSAAVEVSNAARVVRLSVARGGAAKWLTSKVRNTDMELVPESHLNLMRLV